MTPTVGIIIVAAGRGSRAGTGPPKQWRQLAGRPLLAWTLEAIARCRPWIDRALVVIHPDDRPLYGEATSAVALPPGWLLPPAPGGITRQASVLAGLEAMAAAGSPDAVLIHDAARPFVTAELVQRLATRLTTVPAAIAAIPVADTLKRGGADGTLKGSVERSGLWQAQTPQGFRFAAILEAHRRAAATGLETLTDDAAVAEWAGIPVVLVEASARNFKLTTREDIAMAEALLAGASAPATTEFRTGQGFDVHRLIPGDHLWLAGIRIPHDHGLEGHSDADVVLHALTDALLGAIADGDIGLHFPPGDPAWRGASSHHFASFAAVRVRDRGGRIVNVDLTILCEAPRISPRRVAMQQRIAEILAIPADRVGIKATTTERLGFTGRREGIAAMAIATVELPLR